MTMTSFAVSVVMRMLRFRDQVLRKRAYGRLASVGQPQFGKHVVPALANLLDAADKAGLDALGALAEDLLASEERKGKSEKCHHHDGNCHCHGRHH